MAKSRGRQKKTTANAKAKADAAEVEGKKVEVTAKKEERKSQSAKKDLEDTSKSKAALSEAINTFRVRALGLDWSRQDLIKEAQTLFSGVVVEEFSNTQIAFTIDGERTPEEGYFTVS